MAADTRRTICTDAESRMLSSILDLCLRDDGVLENTDALDHNLNFRPWLEWPDTGRGAGGDQVTGFQRHKPTYISDYIIHPEQHLRHGCVLFLLAIHESLHAQTFVIGFVAPEHARAYGAKSVEAFSTRPLAVLLLQIARRHIVDACVSQNISASFGAR